MTLPLRPGLTGLVEVGRRELRGGLVNLGTLGWARGAVCGLFLMGGGTAGSGNPRAASFSPVLRHLLGGVCRMHTPGLFPLALFQNAC